MSSEELSAARFGRAFLDFLETVNRTAPPAEPTLLGRIEQHLEMATTSLPVTIEQFDVHEHPNVQVALDSYIADTGTPVDIIGMAGEQKQYVTSVLTTILGHTTGRGGPPIAEGPVDRVNIRLSDGTMLPCIQHGLILLHEGDSPLVIAVLGPSTMRGPRQQVHVEVVSTVPEAGHAFLRDLRERMNRHNVYRGHVISVDPGRLDMGAQTLISFHSLPPVAREQVVLPEDLLARLERHSIVFSRHATELTAAGRSLKRGMLLHGSPGTGKTLTLMYLIGQMPDRTVLLTTGVGMGMLKPVMQMARTLAPSMVVLEDVDLIAEQRGNPFAPSGGLLFELLNELDGLGNDVDVIFALTSNRPEALEPALAARPGRVDLAVEFPLPDLGARVRLLELYGKGLTLVDIDLHEIAAGLDGASPAYIKEFLRRAAVLGLEEGAGVSITLAHLEQAREELAGGSELGRRLLGYRSDEATTPHGTFRGFPSF